MIMHFVEECMLRLYKSGIATGCVDINSGR